MAEVHINHNDIKSIVESYERENDTFIVRTFIDDTNKKTCIFYINGKECRIDFYIKKKSVTIQPVGKNITDSKLLVDYVASKGYSVSSETKQFAIPCSQTVVDSLVDYVDTECAGIVTYTKENQIYRFKGYNGDEITFTFYPQTKKALVQGKPFQAYSIVISFLSSLSDYSFEQIVDINNAFADKNTPSSIIRNEMRNNLGTAYEYLDEALLKSISGSLTLLKQKAYCEDYTGCITGEFKALEGYLKKLLIQRFQYSLTKKDTFRMFHKDENNHSLIDRDVNITLKDKIELSKLYLIYTNKRNVYLHSSIDPSQTRIISTLKEAQELSDQILKTIKDSFEVIFQ